MTTQISGNMEQDLQILYTQLAQKIHDIIPIPWSKVYFLGEVTPRHSYHSIFLFEDAQTKEIIVSESIPKRWPKPGPYKMTLDLSYVLLMKLEDIFVDICACFKKYNQLDWYHMTMILDQTGATSIQFDRRKETIERTPIARRVIWAYEIAGYKDYRNNSLEAFQLHKYLAGNDVSDFDQKAFMESLNKERSTSGWDAITSAMKTLYPEQTNPLQFIPLINEKFGGRSPLDAVSVYDGGEFYYFVTYGLSDLYEKTNEYPEQSGVGIELTLKLKKSDCIDDLELKSMAAVLQGLARTIIDSDLVLFPYEYLYTGQTAGIDQKKQSKLTGFLILPSELGTIVTPNGEVEFLELVGMTDHELKQMVEQKATHEQIESIVNQYHLDVLFTDYARNDIF